MSDDLYTTIQCVKKIKDGDKGYFNQIYNKYFPLLINTRLEDQKYRSDFEEISTDSLLIFYNSIFNGSYDSTKSKPSTFINRIFNNKVIDFFRKKKLPMVEQLMGNSIDLLDFIKDHNEFDENFWETFSETQELLCTAITNVKKRVKESKFNIWQDLDLKGIKEPKVLSEKYSVSLSNVSSAANDVRALLSFEIIKLKDGKSYNKTNTIKAYRINVEKNKEGFCSHELHKLEVRESGIRHVIRTAFKNNNLAEIHQEQYYVTQQLKNRPKIELMLFETEVRNCFPLPRKSGFYLIQLTDSKTGYYPRTNWELLKRGEKYKLGRITSNDFMIKDGNASRFHGEIEFRNEQWFYKDKSNNGSLVNDQKIIDQDHALMSKDLIQIFDCFFLFYNVRN